MSKALNNAAGAGGGFPLNRRLRRYGWIAPMIPGMAFLVAISVYPTLYSLNASFYRWNLATVRLRKRRNLVTCRVAGWRCASCYAQSRQ